MNQFPADKMEGFFYNYHPMQFFQEQQNNLHPTSSSQQSHPLQHQPQQQQQNQQQQSQQQQDLSPPKRKNNRDPKSRIWVCGCGRSYGSNAALYTHIKNKHDGFQPQNTIKPPQSMQAGRRGRPLQNIKKDGQFKKGDQFVAIDNLEMRRQIIEYDRDSNQILVAFLEFGEQEVQKNPFEEIVTDKKGDDFLNSGMTQKQILEIESSLKLNFDIEENKEMITESMYKILSRFTQIWKDKKYAFELLKVVIFSQYFDGKSSNLLTDKIRESNNNDANKAEIECEEDQKENKEQNSQQIYNNNMNFPYMKYCSEVLEDFDERVKDLVKKIYNVLNHRDDESFLGDNDSDINDQSQIPDITAEENHQTQTVSNNQESSQHGNKSYSNIDQISFDNNNNGSSTKKKLKQCQTYIIQSSSDNKNQLQQQQEQQKEVKITNSVSKSSENIEKFENIELKDKESDNGNTNSENHNNSENNNNKMEGVCENQETYIHLNTVNSESNKNSAKTSTEIFNAQHQQD